LCESKGVLLRTLPAFDGYIRYVMLSDSIKPDALLKDVKKLERNVAARLARTDLEKEWIKNNDQLELLGKLSRLELTTDEWQELKTISPLDIFLKNTLSALES